MVARILEDCEERRREPAQRKQHQWRVVAEALGRVEPAEPVVVQAAHPANEQPEIRVMPEPGLERDPDADGGGEKQQPGEPGAMARQHVTEADSPSPLGASRSPVRGVRVGERPFYQARPMRVA